MYIYTDIDISWSSILERTVHERCVCARTRMRGCHSGILRVYLIQGSVCCSEFYNMCCSACCSVCCSEYCSVCDPNQQPPHPEITWTLYFLVQILVCACICVGMCVKTYVWVFVWKDECRGASTNGIKWDTCVLMYVCGYMYERASAGKRVPTGPNGWC